MDDLKALAYPRHMHKTDAALAESRIVHSLEEAQQAQRDGFSVTYVSPDEHRARVAGRPLADPNAVHPQTVETRGPVDETNRKRDDAPKRK